MWVVRIFRNKHISIQMHLCIKQKKMKNRNVNSLIDYVKDIVARKEVPIEIKTW